MCQGKLLPANDGLECENCHRCWRQNDEGWETVVRVVIIDPTKLKEGEKYTDAVKIVQDGQSD
jgi:hypothetical protein